MPRRPPIIDRNAAADAVMLPGPFRSNRARRGASLLLLLPLVLLRGMHDLAASALPSRIDDGGGGGCCGEQKWFRYIVERGRKEGRRRDGREDGMLMLLMMMATRRDVPMRAVR